MARARCRIAWLWLVVLCARPASAVEVTRAGAYALHSSFWISLHQTLIHFAATRSQPDPAGLTAEERAVWESAVAAYGKAAGTGQTIANFQIDVIIMQDVLTRVPDDVTAPALKGPLAEPLLRAASVYRRHWWPGHDRANRFWIGYAAAMLADAGAELAREHGRVYETAWPPSVRVDAAPYAGPYNAHTDIGQLAGVHATVASSAAPNRGLYALEIVVHEASHALVFPDSGSVGEAIRKHAKRLGIEPPRDLWHAILFATAGELTRRALAARGIVDYAPYAYTQGLYDRAWPKYREPIETHWLPYVTGKGTLDEAIGRIVEAAPKPR